MIEGKPIPTKEYLWVYKKNHFGSVHASYDSLESYLNLYINFKLKAIDAKAQGLDRDSSYINEVKTYEKALHAQKKAGRRNADYDLIMSEYKDAVLMFTLSEMKIWNTTQSNEDKLREFYSTNSDKYHQKAFEEVKDQVVIDYQAALEQEWIRELRKKYKVTVNTGELRRLAKQ